MTVLAISGLAREARIAAGAGIETVQAGGDPARLRAALAGRASSELRAVISFGIAGGLDPALRPGDVVIGTGVVQGSRHWTCTPAIVTGQASRLRGLGVALVTADLAGEEQPAMSLSDKSRLRERTRAAAVDMESQVAAAFAEEHGLRFGIVRVVCDPAERALPPFAATTLKSNGEPDIAAVLAAIVRREARLGAVLQLARDSGAAFRSLGRARALLGLTLGVDA